jgi:hypothetical protein
MQPTNLHTFGRDEDLQAVLAHRIEQRRPAATATLDRFQLETEGLEDHIVRLGKDGAVHYGANGHVNVYGQNAKLWTLHPHASTQLGERIGIPGAFLRDLVAGEEWQRKAAADLLEAHTQNTERQRLLFRSVNGELRGVLSDSYKRLNSLRIVKDVMDAAAQFGAVPVDAHFTDTRLYLELLNPTVVAIPTANNGTRMQAFGLRLTNSDYGDGALDVRFLMIEAICYNGAVIESAFRQVHLGGRLPDNLELSERTYRFDSATTASAIRDVTLNFLSTDRIRHEIDKVQAASADVIDVDREVKRLTKGVIGKGEGEQLVKLLSNSRPEDGLQGAASRFKLSQALGTLANQPTTGATRSRELQEIAGDLLKRKGAQN